MKEIGDPFVDRIDVLMPSGARYSTMLTAREMLGRKLETSWGGLTGSSATLTLYECRWTKTICYTTVQASEVSSAAP